LRRIIQNEIENEISTKFLTGEYVENAVITIMSKNKSLKFKQELKNKNRSLKKSKKRIKSTSK